MVRANHKGRPYRAITSAAASPTSMNRISCMEETIDPAAERTQTACLMSGQRCSHEHRAAPSSTPIISISHPAGSMSKKRHPNRPRRLWQNGTMAHPVARPSRRSPQNPHAGSRFRRRFDDHIRKRHIDFHRSKVHRDLLLFKLHPDNPTRLVEFPYVDGVSRLKLHHTLHPRSVVL